GVPGGFGGPRCPPRFSVAGDSLSVAAVDYGDQGRFRCRAWTRLDAAEAEAELRVVAGAGRVWDSGILDSVFLGFLGSVFNPSLPAEFVVEQEEAIFSPGRFVEVLTVPGSRPWASLPLSPYGRYRFRVLAVNGYGRGEPSAASAVIST
ncbi:NGCA protein, partial [Hirundo rustica]|nr:NGCA protein [Hirundo rustica]